VIFRRRRSAPSGEDRAPEGADVEGQACPSLGKALERTFRLDHPSILDLGPMSGPTVTRLAGRGARVTVDDFEPPPPSVADEGDDAEDVGPAPLRLEHPDAAFDLVLVWEHVDFVPPDRLEEFFSEVRRVLAEDGWLLMFSLAKTQPRAGRPARYRVLADDRIVREITERPELRRWVHPTRTIERALRGFSVQRIHLQRNQLREILATKRQLGERRVDPTVAPRRPTHAKPVRR